jgi:hypothetical protein
MRIAGIVAGRRQRQVSSRRPRILFPQMVMFQEVEHGNWQKQRAKSPSMGRTFAIVVGDLACVLYTPNTPGRKQATSFTLRTAPEVSRSA